MNWAGVFTPRYFNMALTPHAGRNSAIEIREISGTREMRLVERLQIDVWGLPDLDVVPLYQLAAAQAAGGALLGAFSEGELIGFAYGFVGLEGGRLTHHSHMLAVRPEYRNFSVGYRLKLAQREFVMRQGINEMTWTFDPLQSMNAHFNFARLGVTANRYLIDFYGSDAASFLHHNGTDRLWVSWQLASPSTEARMAGEASGEWPGNGAVVIVENGPNDAPLFLGLETAFFKDRAIIQVPSHIARIEKTDPELGAAWRTTTRWAFVEAFNAGFRVTNFHRGTEAGSYLLERSGEPAL